MSSSSSGLTEKVFETIIKKIKEENHDLVVADNSSDSEDITDVPVNRQNTFCETATTSNECQNNVNIPKVPESNSLSHENENLSISRQTKHIKTRANLSSKQTPETISPITSKNFHECDEFCFWCFRLFMEYNKPVHIGKLLRNIEIVNAILQFDDLLRTDSCLCVHCFEFLKSCAYKIKKALKVDIAYNSREITPAVKELRIETNRKSNQQTRSLKAIKNFYSCSVSNCHQDLVHTLSVNECKLIQKVFTKFNFSIIIGPFFFLTSNVKKRKSLLAFCKEHQHMINTITACQLCNNKVESFDFEDCKMYDHWNSILSHNNIDLKLYPGMFLCLTCKSCITDNDFLSPSNLECLQDNVKEKNSERIKTFVTSNTTISVSHQDVSVNPSIVTRSKSKDLKIKDLDPLVTSTYVSKRSNSKINEKKKDMNYKSMTNLLNNENLKAKPEMKNVKAFTNEIISESNDAVQIKLVEENHPSEYITIVNDMKFVEENNEVLEHDEEVKTEPVVDSPKHNSVAYGTEIFTTNDDTADYTDNNLVKDENEETHQYSFYYDNEHEESNNFNLFSDLSHSSHEETKSPSPVMSSQFSHINGVVSNQFSQINGVFNVNVEDAICLESDENCESVDSNDESDQNSYFSSMSVKSQVRSNPVELKKNLQNTHSNISNTDMKKRILNTLKCNKSVMDKNENSANNFYTYDPINNNIARYNNKNINSDDEEVDEMLISKSNYEEQCYVSCDEDEMPYVNPKEYDPTDVSNKQGLSIKSTSSMKPNTVPSFQFDRTLKKVPVFRHSTLSTGLRKRHYTSNNDESDDDSESVLSDHNSLNSEPIINLTKLTRNFKSKPVSLKVDSKHLNLSKKNKTASSKTQKVEEFWNKAITDRYSNSSKKNKTASCKNQRVEEFWNKAITDKYSNLSKKKKTASCNTEKKEEFLNEAITDRYSYLLKINKTASYNTEKKEEFLNEAINDTYSNFSKKNKSASCKTEKKEEFLNEAITDKYSYLSNKNKTASGKNQKEEEFWNKVVSDLIDFLNDPNNPEKEVLDNVAERMNGNVIDILNYLMDNQQNLCDGKLVVSKNADSKINQYFKKNLESVNDGEFFDIDVSTPLSSSPPLRILSESSTADVNFPTIDNICPTSNSKAIMNSANYLSNQQNSLHMTALKTSKSISSTKTMNHSSVDSQKTVSKSSVNFNPQFNDTNCIQIPINQSKPTISKSKPIISKPKPIISKPKPIISKPKPIISKPKPIISKPKLKTSKSRPIINKSRAFVIKSSTIITPPRTHISQLKSLISQPRPLISQPRPIISQPRPLISQSMRLISQPRPLICQPRRLISQPRPIICRPTTVQPAFQLPTAVRSTGLSFMQNNALSPNLNTQTIRNVSPTNAKFVIVKKPLNPSPTK